MFGYVDFYFVVFLCVDLFFFDVLVDVGYWWVVV